MKAIFKVYPWKTAICQIAVILFSLLLTGCYLNDEGPFAPYTDTRGSIMLKPAIGIKPNEATLVGVLVPQHQETTFTFQYRLTYAELAWHDLPLAESFSGLDSIEVRLTIDNLEAGSEYLVTAKGYNQAGVIISSNYISFITPVADYDGNIYQVVRVNEQVWLQENFKGTHFANGDPIPNITDSDVWGELTSPAYCWYNNDPEVGKVYGGLYNFYTATDPRGLIIGFHTPSLSEWMSLSFSLGGDTVAGGKMKEAGYVHWNQPNNGATNRSEFTALPGGTYQNSNILDLPGFSYNYLGETAVFWSTTLFLGETNIAYASKLRENSEALKRNGGLDTKTGLSIRLVQDWQMPKKN